MFNLRLTLVSGLTLLFLSPAAVLADTVLVDLSTIANGTWCNAGGERMWNCTTLPSGKQIFDGQAFNISGAGGGNNAWFASVAANDGAGTVDITVPINVAGAKSVQTLINTFWGQSGTSYDTITFTGSAGAKYSVDLAGNSGIRDYNNWVWTNSISGTTQEVWNNGEGQRLDEQIFTLPAAFANQTLESMTISDTGNYYFSRAFLAALTVDTIGAAADPPSADAPEPMSLTLVGGTLLALGLLFRRRMRC